eukprot:9499844-Pyramimonas_sp.AAC.1
MGFKFECPEHRNWSGEESNHVLVISVEFPLGPRNGVLGWGTACGPATGTFGGAPYVATKR